MNFNAPLFMRTGLNMRYWGIEDKEVQNILMNGVG
jgi:hypothetical protein